MTTSAPRNRNAVELRPDSVIKKFHHGNRGACEREWRALSLLASYAPGLAPVPHRTDLTAEEPVVVMSRVPGGPMRGEPLGDRQLGAMAAAVTELYAAVPADVLAGVPVRPGRQRHLIDQIHTWTPRIRPRVGGEVGEAMDRGLEWLARSGLEGEGAGGQSEVPPVFGPGDGNLANYLWDGTRVRIVDFEDSGLSDRPFELAEITEHVASWAGPPFDVDAFLGLFDLHPAERVRLPKCRRLLALVWLFLLSSDDPRHPRNPPGTAERQAARLSALLA
ncbi:phosphotransferase family protein [Streptomyces sp. NPDC057654]|uniref:phosphotransferase family protein n=1 Tax=Streptomyces sp. NPDC057654 TaxID=3346196 RepID=UPI003699A948